MQKKIKLKKEQSVSYPSENQKDAIKFLFNAVESGEPVVVLSGEGGSGKTTIAKELIDSDHHLTFSATTNKAANKLNESINKNRLKHEKIDCGSLHSIISRPVFKLEYQELEAYYEQKLESDFHSDTVAFLKRHNVNEDQLDNFGSVHELLKFMNLDPFNDEIFVKFALSDPQSGVLIIDEASMLPSKSIYKHGSLKVIGLDSAMHVFKSIILLGDIDQLPPIQGASSFDGLPKFILTENFRANQSIVNIVQSARKGDPLEIYQPKNGENVKVLSKLSDSWYKETNMKTNVVHIVYRNKTRKAITKKIRGMNPSYKEGEPIYYNGFSNDYISKGEIGVVRGEWAAFNEKFDKNGKIIDEGYKVSLKRKRFDEYTDQYSILRYGYVMTAHMSQGSEFDHVIVHLGDIPHFIAGESLRKWVYTAVSRAKLSVTIVR